MATAPVCGEAFPDRDISRPNAAYLANMDQIIECAAQLSIGLAIGLDHPVLRLANLANARTYGRWIDPRDGSSQAAGPLTSAGVQAFAAPPDWEDALLLIQSG